MNWKLCVICQKSTSEGLKCPLSTPGRQDKLAPYDSFLKRVNVFRELNQLALPLSHLVNGIIANDLVVNRAHWHKSCHMKFSNDKIERLKRKRTKLESSDADATNTKRACIRRQSLDKNSCIFCLECDDTLHSVSTLETDASIRSMAIDLQDFNLLAKIEGGDLIALEAKYA